jgi:hypothetical protein
MCVHSPIMSVSASVSVCLCLGYPLCLYVRIRVCVCVDTQVLLNNTVHVVVLAHAVLACDWRRLVGTAAPTASAPLEAAAELAPAGVRRALAHPSHCGRTNIHTQTQTQTQTQTRTHETTTLPAAVPASSAAVVTSAVAGALMTTMAVAGAGARTAPLTPLDALAPVATVVTTAAAAAAAAAASGTRLLAAGRGAGGWDGGGLSAVVESGPEATLAASTITLAMRATLLSRSDDRTPPRPA